MIHEVDEALRRLLAEYGVPGGGGELAFDAPTKDWTGQSPCSTTTPTPSNAYQSCGTTSSPRRSQERRFRVRTGKLNSRSRWTYC